MDGRRRDLQKEVLRGVDEWRHRTIDRQIKDVVRDGGGSCNTAEWCMVFFFFFSSRRRHTRFDCDWSSDVCSSDLYVETVFGRRLYLRISGRYSRRPNTVST